MLIRSMLHVNGRVERIGWIGRLFDLRRRPVVHKRHVETNTERAQTNITNKQELDDGGN